MHHGFNLAIDPWTFSGLILEITKQPLINIGELDTPTSDKIAYQALHNTLYLDNKVSTSDKANTQEDHSL